DRIIAEGLRHPFRFAVKPGGTDRVWLGDVGWGSGEEIDPIILAGEPRVEDYGCAGDDGLLRPSGYHSPHLPDCRDVYPHRPRARSAPAGTRVTSIPGPRGICATGASTGAGSTKSRTRRRRAGDGVQRLAVGSARVLRGARGRQLQELVATEQDRVRDAGPRP